MNKSLDSDFLGSPVMNETRIIVSPEIRHWLSVCFCDCWLENVFIEVVWQGNKVESAV